MTHESADHRPGDDSPESCRHCRLILSRQNVAAEELTAKAALTQGRIERAEQPPAKTCPRCGGAQIEGLLCQACAAQLRIVLGEMPGWLRELDVTLSRQDRTGSGGKATDTPLPIRETALDVKAYVRNQLSTWVRELGLGDERNLADNPRAWCRWLADRIERIRVHAAADECMDQVLYCRDIIVQAVDARPDRDLCGYCPTCGKAMYAARDADHVVCRDCQRAGLDGRHDAGEVRLALQQRRLAMRDGERDKLVTRSVAMAAVAHMGKPVRAGTMRIWIHRGREGKPGGIVERGQDDAGLALYRLGDVMDRAGVEATG